MNKALIFPVIALVALFAQRFLNVEWTSEELQTITEGVFALTVLIGIFMNPKKPE